MQLRTVFLFLLSFSSVAALAQQPPGAVEPPATKHATVTPIPHLEGIATDATQAATAPSQPLTLEDAIAMGRMNSPRLRAARGAVERAAGAVQTSRAYSNPQVQYLGGNQSARDVPNPGVPGLLQHWSASQTFELPAERAARRNVALQYEEASHFRQTAEELALTAEIKRAFYEALRSKEEVGQAQENLTLVEDLRRRVEVEVRVGEKGRLELTRAEAELARARFAVRSAQLALANSIAFLRATIAASADAIFDPVGDLELPVELPPLADARELVLKTNPQLFEAQTVLAGTNAAVKHEETLRVPHPNFYGEYERQPDQAFWRVGVTIALPLWDRRRGPIAEAVAVTREAGAMRDQRRIEILSTLERAYNQYQLDDQQVKALESGSMHEAESAVDAAKAAYRFGERGIVEVLDAQRVLQSVRGDLLGARFARQSALVELELLGVLNTGGRP